MAQWLLLIAVVVAVLSTCNAASSVPVGCFKYDKALELQKVDPGSSGCEKACLDKKLPVWGEYNKECYGTMVVPPASLLVAGTTCAAGQISLAFYMQYPDATDKWTCSVAAVPLTADKWFVDNPSTVTVANGKVTITIDGTAGKTVGKIWSKNKTGYGLYSSKMTVPSTIGAVSAMYLTTQDQMDKNKPTNWDELDYEILNQCEGKGCIPASGWANTFKEGSNKFNGKEWGTVMWKDGQVVNKPTLYTFSWHPNDIFWYKGTEFIYTENSDMHPLPWRTSTTVFVLWWNEEAENCKYFGGCGTKGTKATLVIEDVRQLTCADKTGTAKEGGVPGTAGTDGSRDWRGEAGYDHAGESSYGHGDESESSYGRGDESESSYGRADVSGSGYGRADESESSYGRGDESESSYGRGDESESSYGRADASGSGYGRADESESSYGRADESESSYGRADASGSGYGRADESESWYDRGDHGDRSDESGWRGADRQQQQPGGSDSGMWGSGQGGDMGDQGMWSEQGAGLHDASGRFDVGGRFRDMGRRDAYRRDLGRQDARRWDSSRRDRQGPYDRSQDWGRQGGWNGP